MKKFIFLILTLAIPVSIFLFLKIFGNNEFEVPVLFEKGIPGCAESAQPHKVPPVNLSPVKGSAKTTSTLEGDLIFGVLDEKDSGKLRNQVIQLVRIQDAFYETGSPTFVLLTNQDNYTEKIITQFDDVGLLEGNYQLGILNSGQLNGFITCGLGIADESTNKLVLVDPKKRIRGLYDGLEIDQTEQLILELKILRKQ